MVFISACICNFLDLAPDGRDSYGAYLFAPRQSHSLSVPPSRQRVSKRSITSWTLAPDGIDSRGAYLFAPTQTPSLSPFTPSLPFPAACVPCRACRALLFQRCTAEKYDVGKTRLCHTASDCFWLKITPAEVSNFEGVFCVLLLDSGMLICSPRTLIYILDAWQDISAKSSRQHHTHHDT